LLESAESLAHLVDKAVVVNGSGTNDDHVLTSKVSSFVLVEHVDVKVLELVVVTTDRLSHLVVSEGIVMASLESGSLIILTHVFVLLSLLLLGNLKLGSIEGGVSDGVAKHRNSTAEVTLVAGDVQVGHLAISIARDSGTHAFDFFGELGLGGTLRASQKHLGQQVGGTGGLWSVLARSRLDVDTDAATRKVNGYYIFRCGETFFYLRGGL